MGEILDIFYKIKDSSMKAVLPTTETDIKIIRTGFLMPNILKQDLGFAPNTICVLPEHKFFNNLNKKVANDLISGGIIQYWYSYLLDFEAKAVLAPPKEPKVFNISDLNFGFCVWLTACAIAVTAFVVEILYFVVTMKLKTFVRRYTGLYHLMGFFSRGRIHL